MSHHKEIADGSVAGIAVTLFLLGAAPAGAESATSAIGVAATIAPHCAISLGPIAFGSIDPPNRAPIDTAGTLAVSCTEGTSWTASTERGDGERALPATRHRSSPSGQLSYSLHVDRARSRVWGDGSAATAVHAPIASDPEQAAPGSSDLVVVIITY